MSIGSVSEAILIVVSVIVIISTSIVLVAHSDGPGSDGGSDGGSDSE